jgi:hypothetical protein
MKNRKGDPNIDWSFTSCDLPPMKDPPQGLGGAQSQRDCGLQPRVGAQRLPWVIIEIGINANGVAAMLGIRTNLPRASEMQRVQNQADRQLPDAGALSDSIPEKAFRGSEVFSMPY